MEASQPQQGWVTSRVICSSLLLLSYNALHNRHWQHFLNVQKPTFMYYFSKYKYSGIILIGHTDPLIPATNKSFGLINQNIYTDISSLDSARSFQ